MSLPGRSIAFTTIFTAIQLCLAHSTTAQTTSAIDDKNRAPIVVSSEAHKVHSAGYVWDGHNDLPWAMRTLASSSFELKDISKSQPELMTDIPRLRSGNVGVQFWSVFVPASTRLEGSSLKITIEQIQLVKDMCERYPETFLYATSMKDVDKARAEGKIASLIGMEGGHSIENSIANLNRLYEMGARYMTLTHSSTLDWADSSTDEAKSDGLSPFGEEVVREMNRLGMLVDLSHVSTATMKDALRITTAPIIFSHSSADGVASHPRNVDDEILPLVRENGGVIMVNFYNGFVVPAAVEKSKERMLLQVELEKQNLTEEERKAMISRWERENPPVQGTVHDVLDHIDYLVKHCGEDHVGLGADYDGVSLLPKQLDDVSTYPVITQGLLDRGYTQQQIHKIMSGNIYRVFKAAEIAATK